MASARLAALLCAVFALCLFASTAHGREAGASIPTQRLVLTQARVLYAYFEGRYQEIKRAEIIYGHGWLDDHRVFVAYQQERTGEAVAVLEVIDLRDSRTTKLTSLGGIGESHFDVNSTTGEVVYADSKGVKVLRINNKTNAYKIDEVKKDVLCYGAFWVDTKTAGCLVYQGADKAVFTKFPVSPAH